MAALPTATYSAPGVTLYAALGGGGGGASGSQISSSGAYVLCSTNGALYMGNVSGAAVPDVVVGDSSQTLATTIQNGSGDSMNVFNGSITFVTSNVDMTATNLNVSSINGAAPGSGGFFSTLSVPLPIQTSTVLMELPPGTWSYNGLAIFTGNTNVLNGFANSIADNTPNYFGTIFPNEISNTTYSNVVPCVMTLNINDSPLSTVKLICANNSASLAGTWNGGVFKLF